MKKTFDDLNKVVDTLLILGYRHQEYHFLCNSDEFKNWSDLFKNLGSSGAQITAEEISDKVQETFRVVYGGVKITFIKY